MGEFETVMQTQDEVDGLHNCREKNAKLFVMALIKRDILSSRKVFYTTSCTRKSVLAFQNDAIQNTDFSFLNCQLKRKKIDTPSL